MEKVRATQATVGKISPQQSGDLPPSQVIDIDPDEEFKVVRREKGHVVVELHIFEGHTKPAPGASTPAHRRINDRGIAIIKEREGLHLESYLCPADKWTIGYGSTDGIESGMTITKDEAEHLLIRDLKRFELGVSEAVNVPLNDNQFSALVSFAFNVGMGNFRESTLLRRLNNGEYDAVPVELALWIWAKGKKLKGLVRRRRMEGELFTA